MKGSIFKLATFFTLLVLITSTQVPGNFGIIIIGQLNYISLISRSYILIVKHLYLENELIVDLSGSSVEEWIIETDSDHIFYFSFLIEDNVDQHLLPSSLTVINNNVV